MRKMINIIENTILDLCIGMILGIIMLMVVTARQSTDADLVNFQLEMDGISVDDVCVKDIHVDGDEIHYRVWTSPVTYIDGSTAHDHATYGMLESSRRILTVVFGDPMDIAFN